MAPKHVFCLMNLGRQVMFQLKLLVISWYIFWSSIKILIVCFITSVSIY